MHSKHLPDETSWPWRRINVVGASGSGTSTLGRALSARLAGCFVDADDFYWKPTHPPFREKYDPALRLQRLLDELSGQGTFVVAGSVDGWGAALEDSFDLVVFLSLPTALRLARLQARETALFGGADPDFMAWAAQYDEGRLPGRSRARHEAWLATRPCRVLRLEEDWPVDRRVEAVLSQVRQFPAGDPGRV